MAKRKIEREVDDTRIYEGMKPVGRTKADEIMASTERKVNNLRIKRCKTCKKLPCICPKEK